MTPWHFSLTRLHNGMIGQNYQHNANKDNLTRILRWPYTSCHPNSFFNYLSCFYCVLLLDWLIDGEWIDWLIDGWIDCLIDWWMDGLIAWLIDWVILLDGEERKRESITFVFFEDASVGFSAGTIGEGVGADGRSGIFSWTLIFRVTSLATSSVDTGAEKLGAGTGSAAGDGDVESDFFAVFSSSRSLRISEVRSRICLATARWSSSIR